MYPVWFEVARNRTTSKTPAESYAEMERRGVMIPVTGISCKYRQPSRYDDTPGDNHLRHEVQPGKGGVPL